MRGENSAPAPAGKDLIGTTQRSRHAALRPEHVRAVRLGHGANCSSVGSVIDTLFFGAVAGAAIFAAVCAAVEDETSLPPSESASKGAPSNDAPSNDAPSKDAPKEPEE